MKSRKKKYDGETDMDHDDTFYFIAGYTSGGFPYGVTWEESDEDGFREGSDQNRWKKMQEESDEDELPF